MKKILMLLSLTILAGCLRAENYDILGFRNDVFVMSEGYKITFYDDGPVLIKSEVIEENNYKFNEAQTIYKGYSVLNNKIYRSDVYAEDLVRPNKNGALSSLGLPRKFSAEEKFKIIGQVEIDGVVYRLVPDVLESFAFLIDNQGVFYNKAGEIKGSYLVLLDSEFFPYPKDLRMVDVNIRKAEQTKPTEGFDVKYDGIRLDRIWFTYFDYEAGEKGTFENISFPNKPGLITINGINMRVLRADNDKITYMLLK
ncbi:MAG: hypothetical protein IJW72_04150 [Alphaproteobacteria bacterium]|nr:hypothetical protein [Alphaproteobacteria bacterium]